MHISTAYGIPFIPTKEIEQKPKIIFCSTPSKKDGFYSKMANESSSLMFGQQAWANANFEANVFAQLPKFSWVKPCEIMDKVIFANRPKIRLKVK